MFGLSFRPRFDLVVNLLMAKAFNEGVITIFNGEQWRPFIHVHDVAAGIIKTLNAPLPVVSGQIYNLGDTRLNYTLTQISHMIKKMFPNTQGPAHRRHRSPQLPRVVRQDRNATWASPARGKLEDGMRQLRQAFEDKEIMDYTDTRYYNQKFLKIAGSPSRNQLDEHLMAAFANAPKNLAPSRRPFSAPSRAATPRRST